MTWEQFAEMFALLALQLQKSDADEAMGRAYFVALKALEPELVAMAAQRMGQQGGATGTSPHWFPKSSEWKALALKIEGERYALMQHRIRDYHQAAHAVLCLVCEDTGWTVTTSQGACERWRHCDCRALRRLEVLGRCPLPALPAAKEPA